MSVFRIHVNLLLIFGKDYFGMFLMCQGKVSLSMCPFFIFRFPVHVTPHGLYIYHIYLTVLMGFYLISLEYVKIQTCLALNLSQLSSSKFGLKFLGIHACVQFGDNWYSTSRNKIITRRKYIYFWFNAENVMQIRVRLINEVITAILEICWSSWEQREKSDLSKIEVCKYIEST